MRIITVSGAPEEIGLQHGQQIGDLRNQLVDTIDARLSALRQLDADRPQLLQPIVAALEGLDAPLLAFLRGLALSLELDFDRLLRYTLSSYLRDRQETGDMAVASAAPSEGCTTWAATTPLTAHGVTLLAKNRDYHRDHIPLQLLARVTPATGYEYIAIGSAGSPDVFSSGINQRGLAVADTHVLSHDLGPGLSRYSLMRELLQYHADTASGLDYLRSVRQMGGGTMVLADRSGHLAVWESGHESSGLIERRQGFVVSANHFVTARLESLWIDNEPPALQGNSTARYRRVSAALAGAVGIVGPNWAQALMTSHGSPLDALCRHPLPENGLVSAGSGSSTISSVVFLPNGLAAGDSAPALLVAVGEPCHANWETHHLGFVFARK